MIFLDALLIKMTRWVLRMVNFYINMNKVGKMKWVLDVVQRLTIFFVYSSHAQTTKRLWELYMGYVHRWTLCPSSGNLYLSGSPVSKSGQVVPYFASVWSNQIVASYQVVTKYTTRLRKHNVCQKHSPWTYFSWPTSKKKAYHSRLQVRLFYKYLRLWSSSHIMMGVGCTPSILCTCADFSYIHNMHTYVHTHMYLYYMYIQTCMYTYAATWSRLCLHDMMMGGLNFLKKRNSRERERERQRETQTERYIHTYVDVDIDIATHPKRNVGSKK